MNQRTHEQKVLSFLGSSVLKFHFMDSERKQLITEILQELLRHMGLVGQIEFGDTSETAIFNIRTPDSGILIGSRGMNLGSLQYLARLLVFKKTNELVHFVIDVEGYKKTREEFLRELARQAASRVRETKESLLLKPMAAYERRIIHDEIGQLSDIMSESAGEEPERRILIRPKQ